MLWLTVIALGLLAACVFLKHLLIYVALICAWAGVIFWTGPSDFPGYIKLAAVAVAAFGIMSIFKLRNRSEL